MLSLQESQQMLIQTGELAGKGKHPYFPVSIPIYHGSCPRPHHVRYGVEDTEGMAAPALQHW